MSKRITVTIDVTKHASNPADALGFRFAFEDAIEEYGIGEVVGGGATIDGNSIDVSADSTFKQLRTTQTCLESICSRVLLPALHDGD